MVIIQVRAQSVGPRQEAEDVNFEKKLILSFFNFRPVVGTKTLSLVHSVTNYAQYLVGSIGTLLLVVIVLKTF